MESRHPLTEMSNQRQPRRKVAQTYGKKKTGTLSTQRLHQQLFGQDENKIEEILARLSLDDAVITSLVQEHTIVKKTQSRRNGAASTNEKQISLISEEDTVTLAPLQELSSSKAELFSVFGEKIAKSCQIEKIGEGSFAEVFKLTPLLPEIAPSTSSKRSRLPSNVSSIIKIIPLKHPTSSVSVIDRVSTISSVAREINLLKHLDILHGFTGFGSLRIVKGEWPVPFLEAFRAFKKQHRKRAINVAPDQDFDDNQIYALVEMDDAGTEISLIKKPSVFQVYDIFWTTVILLANAEERIEFEHRDLHLSNICIKPRSISHDAISDCKVNTSDPTLDIDNKILSTMTTEPNLKLGLSNLDITIIDYTVARAKLPTITTNKSTTKVPSHSSANNQIVYDSMDFASDPFSRTSSIESTLQFSTYKKCRAVAKLHQSRLQSRSLFQGPNQGQDKYSLSTPLTNTIWLGYLLRSLLRRSRSPRTGKLHILPSTSGSRSKASNSKIQSSIWDSLLFVDQVLNNGPDPHTHNRQPLKNKSKPQSKPTVRSNDTDNINDVEDDEVNQLNNKIYTESDFVNLPSSARDLLDRAVREAWLSQEEIEAFKRRVESEG